MTAATTSRRRLDWICERARETPADDVGARVLLVLAYERVRRDEADTQVAPDEAAVSFTSPVWDNAHKHDEYVALVERVRVRVQEVIPPGKRVLVLSKGDNELLRLGAIEAEHFPRDPSGAYAGHYPQDGKAAVSHLNELLKRGADYLVVPATAFWWLDYYHELAQRLGPSPLVADADCVIFELSNMLLQPERT